MEFETLKGRLPKIGERLVEEMQRALDAFTHSEMTFDEATPSISITYQTPEHGALKFTLSIEPVE